MELGRRWGTALAAFSLVVVLVACGGSAGSSDDGDAGVDELPFGLEQLEGTELIGRPAVYEHDYARYRGELVRARSLRAAYRVTADDPLAVVRAWLAQLDGLALDRWFVQPAVDPLCPSCQAPPGFWLTAHADHDGDGVGDSARVALWATDEAPILRVDVSRASDDPSRTPAIEEPVDPPAPAAVVEWTERTAGDVLFSDLGDDIHVPAGTRTLTPRLQSLGATETLLAAEDGEAAVRALLDEAAAVDERGEVNGPETTTTADGVEVVEASFAVPAGGASFEVVTVQGPDAPYATMYVFNDLG